MCKTVFVQYDSKRRIFPFKKYDRFISNMCVVKAGTWFKRIKVLLWWIKL